MKQKQMNKGLDLSRVASGLVPGELWWSTIDQIKPRTVEEFSVVARDLSEALHGEQRKKGVSKE